MLGYAQHISVKSFTPVPMDLSASTESRQDYNGNYCALIKIVAQNIDFIVQGNVIGEIKQNGTEHWCYITNGTKELKILPVNCEPIAIRFEDYGLPSVISKKVYSLVIIQEDDSDKTPNAKNLDIVVQDHNGERLFWDFDRFKSLSHAERDRFQIIGIYFKEDNLSFILNCNDSFPKKYTFEEAVKKYGIDLPTKNQMDIICRHYDYLRNVFPLIGDDGMRVHYWTSTKEGEMVSTNDATFYECHLYLGAFVENGYVTSITASPEFKKGWKFKAWVRTVQNL